MKNLISIQSGKKHKYLGKRPCNLCKEEFNLQSKYERICLNCKRSNPLYHYYEWVPRREDLILDFDQRVPEKYSA